MYSTPNLVQDVFSYKKTCFKFGMEYTILVVLVQSTIIRLKCILSNILMCKFQNFKGANFMFQYQARSKHF